MACVHLIQRLDGLVNGAAFLVIEREAEPLPPVAEVGGYHEKIGGIIEVRSQQSAILRLPLHAERSHLPVVVAAAAAAAAAATRQVGSERSNLFCGGP